MLDPVVKVNQTVEMRLKAVAVFGSPIIPSFIQSSNYKELHDKLSDVILNPIWRIIQDGGPIYICPIL